METSDASVQPPPLKPNANAIFTLKAICRMHAVGGLLTGQAALLGQLCFIEWKEEKNRLLKMQLIILIGFACLLCVMLFVGALMLVLSWRTIYYVPTAASLIAMYGLGFWLAWSHFWKISAQSDQAFAASRAELVASINLLKNQL
ncbi:MAG: hypothetical protein HKM02_07160 [Pseudomonadales bacterium]|nr:hypothetical protein [Pseudomonadales bacterium]